MHLFGNAPYLNRPTSLSLQSVNHLSPPSFLTERKPRWVKPAHPDNRDKLGSERMNWSDLCSLQPQPSTSLYFCVSLLTCLTFISRLYKILLPWTRSFKHRHILFELAYFPSVFSSLFPPTDEVLLDQDRRRGHQDVEPDGVQRSEPRRQLVHGLR